MANSQTQISKRAERFCQHLNRIISDTKKIRSASDGLRQPMFQLRKSCRSALLPPPPSAHWAASGSGHAAGKEKNTQPQSCSEPLASLPQVSDWHIAGRIWRTSCIWPILWSIILNTCKCMVKMSLCLPGHHRATHPPDRRHSPCGLVGIYVLHLLSHEAAVRIR